MSRTLRSRTICANEALSGNSEIPDGSGGWLEPVDDWVQKISSELGAVNCPLIVQPPGRVALRVSILEELFHAPVTVPLHDPMTTPLMDIVAFATL
ncbi:hypothetical protein [Sphingomonas sp.]|uniref:hypothetical protein n=1 Tax=Sphingomonas sp. TaxID=28214 RepID=UPI003D6D98CB